MGALRLEMEEEDGKAEEAVQLCRITDQMSELRLVEMEEEDGKKEEAMQLCGLPKDIIFEIFMKIPSKYILKLKRVCKAWHVLISDSIFTSSFLHHLRNNNNSSFFFCYHRAQGAKPVNLETLHLDHQNQPKTTILTRIATDWSNQYYYLLPYSINGLVCLIGKNNFCICNPTAEQFRTFSIQERIGPKQTPRGFGFGYDKSKNVYKFVQVYNDPPYIIRSTPPPPYNSMQCAVLTIGGYDTTPSWREIKAPECPVKPIPVVVDGMMYWLVFRGPGVNGVRVLKFDIQDETFRELTVPLELKNDASNTFVSMVELQGRLCIVNKIFNEGVPARMDVWILVKDDWIPRRIVVDHNRGNSFHMDMEPKCIIYEGKKIILHTSKGLESYDTENKLLETTCSELTRYYSTTTYVPSLTPLDM